ncbi:MAG: hypothetical protein AAF587_42010 [Bacteroidota bacterium]
MQIVRIWPFNSVLCLLILICVRCSLSSTHQESQTPHQDRIHSTVWAKGQGLQQVESIIFDHENLVFYASNGQAYAVGHDGFLSKLSETGDLLDLKWIDSLSRPTGMAIYQGKLYVADVNVLLIIDIKAETIIARIPEPIKGSGLNDVAVDEKGEVFVTASFVHAVFKLEQQQLTLWLQDEEQLAWANGLILEQEHLLVAGLKLAKIERQTKRIATLVPKDSVEDFDGIASDGAGGYFLTTVARRALWHMDKELSIHPLDTGVAYFGDIEYLSDIDQLWVPRGNHRTQAYFMSVYEGISK